MPELTFLKGETVVMGRGYKATFYDKVKKKCTVGSTGESVLASVYQDTISEADESVGA